jgi:hypothetical protein
MGVKIDAFPVPRLRDRVIVSADVAYRRALQTDFNDEDRNFPFAQLSLVMILDAHKVFSISLDRVMGQDPTQAFDGPAFTRIAFKIQLTRPQKRSLLRARRATQHII